MKAVYYLILAALAVRLVVAAFTGLGLDESYMVASAHSFDASYYDHPLASWWLELSARALTGSAAPLVVRLPFVALSGVTSWLIYATTNRLFGQKAGFWAVAAYSVSPFFSLAAGCWILPDGPLDAALATFLYALIRALGLPDGAPSPKWWLAVGLFAGLALLSKYNAALVLAGAAAAVMLDPASRPALRKPWPWVAVLLTLAMFSPVVWWNQAHHWSSFHYQGGRMAGLHLRLYMAPYIWFGESLFVLPWLWLPMILVLLRGLRAGPAVRASWLLCWAALLPVTLFSIVGIWSSTHILFHWATPGYLMLFPLLGQWAAGISPILRNRVAIASAAFLALPVLALSAIVSLPFMPVFGAGVPSGKSPLLQMVNWTSIVPQLPPGIDAIAAQRWYDGGKVGYALAIAGDKTPVTVFAGEVHEFYYTAPPASFIGKTVLVLARPWTTAQTISFCAKFFSSFTPGPTLRVTLHGTTLLTIPTFIGVDMRAVPVGEFQNSTGP